MSTRFQNSLVIVTGGTGGLGRAVSQAFQAEGAVVIVTYHSEQEFEELKRDIGAASDRLEGSRVDVTNEAATNKFVEDVIGRHSRVDALVNTVGGYTGGAELWRTDHSSLDLMLALNVRAPHVLMRSVVPAMLKQGHGCIVNVAAKAGLDHPPRAAVYAASKAAELAMMDSLAAELLGTGVRANSVLPSIIDTTANRSAMPHADFSKWPKPQDIARVILFLCSEDAKLIHGASIPVYGSG
jgi:NAD(P)-dependent dehydrogenase (short-subunit alcohol dehydrogenase family)